MEAAHQVCPYSNATRGNVEVVLEVVDGGRGPTPRATSARRTPTS